MPLKFEWNPGKAQKNIKKHRITFNEAATVFSAPLSMTFDDPDHSEDEERFIIIGFSISGKLLMVSYAEKKDSIRIISARKLTRKERKQHERKYL